MSGNGTALKGVPGILRPFKEYLERRGVGKTDQVVYYGVPGTCTPFIELLAFAIRGLGPEQVFVPYFAEEKAKKIVFTDGVGMQVSVGSVPLRPRVVVVMGGLAMPNVPVKVADAKSLLVRYPEAEAVGVCFMSMFEKAGWLEEIRFDLLIDATIDPVQVTGLG